MQTIVADAEGNSSERLVAVFVGDYVDKGLESRQVLDYLLAGPLPGTFDTVYLKGNHDAWLLAFLDEAEVAREWLPNGGAATLFSYGIAAPHPPLTPEALQEAQALFRAALPDAHRRFLETLVPSHVEGDYGFVHAGIRPGTPFDEQQEGDLLWIRDEFLSNRGDHGFTIVHGHSIVDAPEVLGNRIAIDTGAYATGRLTCLAVEGASVRFLTT